MNKERKQRFQDVVDDLENAKNELFDIQTEETEALDSLPEGLRYSDRGDAMQEWIDFIDDIVSSIDNVVDEIEERV